MSSEQLVDLLQDLREVCFESRRVFRSAAGRTEDLELRTFLEKAAEQREQYAAELARVASRIGGEGSEPAWAERTLAAPAAGELETPEQPALTEVRRRERERALPAYRAALEENIPPKVGRLIGRQRAGIEHVQDRLVAYPR